jgi:hypothetical protein
MPETRRDLFRTSVITALGGLAVGAVAGYVAAETFLAPQPPAPPAPGTVAALQDSSTKIWYLFHFEDSSHCRLYSVNCVPSSFSTTGSIDTATWFAVSCKKLIKAATTISYTNSAGSSDSISLTFSGGYLDGPSLSKLIAILPGGVPPQVMGSWNEIGRQHIN